jgi:hypothetical protein
VSEQRAVREEMMGEGMQAWGRAWMGEGMDGGGQKKSTSWVSSKPAGPAYGPFHGPAMAEL